MTVQFEPGQRVRLPHGPDSWVTIDFAQQGSAGDWVLYVARDGDDSFKKVLLTAEDASEVEVLAQDGSGSSAAALAGLWTCWMSAAITDTSISALSASPLRPYTHQVNAVYGAMLPQPWLRFLLADEPGTGKTIMAGLYLSEMRRLGLVRRTLVVTPAGLVSKWLADFDRFFGGGLRRITASTVREHALALDHDLWIVSLELAAVNAAVQEAIRPDRAGWDLVIFDEAHRLTPTAQSYYRVGRLLTRASPRVLLMTATPHRGSEWLFRHLLHLVDPEIYPDPGDDPKRPLTALRPGSLHFLRRMKEDLVDYDGTTKLFKQRRAANYRVPLSGAESEIYEDVLDLVDQFFAPQARPLARIVYGKRAASSLYALAETLKRRLACMAVMSPEEAAVEADPEGEDQAVQDEARVVYADSQSPRMERSAVSHVLARITEMLDKPVYLPSKWRTLIEKCLLANGIRPGGDDQVVIFTEYADTAEWLVERLNSEGYPARIYSGRQAHAERDQVRADFMARNFQAIVSTDAGNEGIDLQAAHILVNFDIPWSLVRLEQRMGRIHRIGQTQDVLLYNLVATETREGDTLLALLESFVTAANELGGQMFDSLSVVADIAAVSYQAWLEAMFGDDELKKADVLAAVQLVSATELRHKAEAARTQEADLSTGIDAMAGLAKLRQESLERLNPAVVEAYLRQLSASGVLRARPTAAGEGVLLLDSRTPLPRALGGSNQALVATTGSALRDSVTDAIPLGPGSLAFADLVASVGHKLSNDLFRGATVKDPASSLPYELLVYTSSFTSPAGGFRAPWSALIKVDPAGETKRVRWECLANLVPADRAAEPWPLAPDVAGAEARRVLANTIEEQVTARRIWFSTAKRALTNLPVDLTLDIADRGERIAARDVVRASAEQRIQQLEALCTIEGEDPRLAARLQVIPGSDDSVSIHRQAHAVALDCARRTLVAEGWILEDVHLEDRGFDLLAVRGQDQQLVAVKGVWGTIKPDSDARLTSIQLRGDELLMAAQHREGYVLYLVESCQDGRGSFFGYFPDPLRVFRSSLHGESVAQLGRSDLIAAREGTTEHFPGQEVP